MAETTMSAAEPPYTIGTDLLGKKLHLEYGKKDPNTPITYFMLLLGKGLSDRPRLTEDEILTELEGLGMNVWRIIENGWKNRILLLLEFNGQSECEREQEREINVKVRECLREKLKKKAKLTLLPDFQSNSLIITRACLYYEKQAGETESEVDKITTEKIGSILRNQYKVLAGDTPIDYFYLYIQMEAQGESVNLKENVLSFLKYLNAGEWKALDERIWPGVYIGYFPKTSGFITERERELTLNEKVRKPLIEKLTEKIKEERGEESQAKAHVIITRACEYTKQD